MVSRQDSSVIPVQGWSLRSRAPAIEAGIADNAWTITARRLSEVHSVHGAVAPQRERLVCVGVRLINVVYDVRYIGVRDRHWCRVELGSEGA